MNEDIVLVERQILVGESLYAEAISVILQNAEESLLIFDQDLSRGNFASVEKYNLLAQFLSKNMTSHLTIILQNAAFFQEKCPRLFSLLSIYGHKMTVHETNNNAKHAKDCFILADGVHYIKRIHIDQTRFKYALNDAESVAQLDGRFKDLLEETEGVITASTLGL